jgi:hypothetical protein
MIALIERSNALVSPCTAVRRSIDSARKDAVRKKRSKSRDQAQVVRVLLRSTSGSSGQSAVDRCGGCSAAATQLRPAADYLFDEIAARYRQAPDARLWRRAGLMPVPGARPCIRSGAGLLRGVHMPHGCEKCAYTLFTTRAGGSALTTAAGPAARAGVQLWMPNGIMMSASR